MPQRTVVSPNKHVVSMNVVGAARANGVLVALQTLPTEMPST